MITDAILTWFLVLPNLLIESLPVVSISIPDNVFDGLDKLCAFLGWFPIAQLMPILYYSITLSLFQAAWALIIRIKSFIPTMGA